MTLAARAALLLLALLLEKFFLNFFIDTRRADTAQGAGALVRWTQHLAFEFLVPFALALALFVFVRDEPALDHLDAEVTAAPPRARWIFLHGMLLVLLAASLTGWYGAAGIRLPVVVLSLLLGAVTLAALLEGLAPLALWRRGAALLGARWAYAATAAAIATAAFTWSEALWADAAGVTFHLVRGLLLPILPELRVDATTRLLAADHFAIYVAPHCSGLEGVTLMLAFSCAWLIYFRRDYRFPRALLLVPAGLLLIFFLNAVRIAALLWIGNSGYRGIALYGFHSEAGWIAFTCVACALVWASRRISWMSRVAVPASGAPIAENPTAGYLLPVLAILAAGMISRAVSSGFETWYGLRLFAGAACLAVCWRQLRSLDWRFGWRGIGTGIVVFGVWLAGSRLLISHHGLPLQLAAMSAPARDIWIAARAATAVLIAPVAEELAYRGYLLRRLVAEDFESVRFEAVRWPALLATAAAFGALHGAMWLPGIVAGIAYGWILVRTGRMGEAIAAHITSNLLLALCVLAAGQWQLW